MRTRILAFLLVFSSSAGAVDDGIPTVGEIIGEQIGNIVQKLQRLQEAKKADKEMFATLRAALWLCEDCSQGQDLKKAYETALLGKDIWYASQAISGMDQDPFFGRGGNQSAFKKLVAEHPDGAIFQRCQGLFDQWTECLTQESGGGIKIILGGSSAYRAAMDACQSSYGEYTGCRDARDRERHFPRFKPGSPLGEVALTQWGRDWDREQLDRLHPILMSLHRSWVPAYGRGLVTDASHHALEEQTEDPIGYLEQHMIDEGFIGADGSWATRVSPERFSEDPAYTRFLQLVHADELQTFDLAQAEDWLARVEEAYGRERVLSRVREMTRKGEHSAGYARRTLLAGLEYPTAGGPTVHALGDAQSERVQALMPDDARAETFDPTRPGGSTQGDPGGGFLGLLLRLVTGLALAGAGTVLAGARLGAHSAPLARVSEAARTQAQALALLCLGMGILLLLVSLFTLSPLANLMPLLACLLLWLLLTEGPHAGGAAGGGHNRPLATALEHGRRLAARAAPSAERRSVIGLAAIALGVLHILFGGAVLI